MKSSWLFLALICLTGAWPWLAPSFSFDGIGPATGQDLFPGWPATWEGALLQPLPLSDRERQFERDFPGRLGHFTDGRRQLVIRWVDSLTRKLHPAADCFRGAGYAVRPAEIRVDEKKRYWGCFDATRSEESLRVCELLFDNAGGSWPDVSSWYWSGVMGASEGPWWAVTVVEKGTEPFSPAEKGFPTP